MTKLFFQLIVGKIIAFLLIFILLSNDYHNDHRCSDPSHQTCDGNCICDGMECNNAD